MKGDQPSSKATRKRVRLYERQNGICPFCDKPIGGIERATFDHLKPRSKGGKDNNKNLVVVHAACNQLKGPFASVEEAEQHCVEVLVLWNKLRLKGLVK